MKAYILRSPLAPVMPGGPPQGCRMLGTGGQVRPQRIGGTPETMTEDLDRRRKRLLYQANHRGTQESDLVIGGFARERLTGFDAADLDRFEALIGVTDADLMDWISGRAEPPLEHRNGVLTLMIDFKNKLLSN
jgi:antitoxin CptB